MKWRLFGAVRLAALCGAVFSAAAISAAEYLGPIDVLASADGKTLYVANYDANSVAVFDVAGEKVVRTIAVPAPPTGLALTADKAKVIVTCAAPRSTVCIVDPASGKIEMQIPAGHTAMAPVPTPDGKRLYVSNRFNDAVSVIDLASKKEVASVPIKREPVAAAITPDGKTVFVAGLLPLDRADEYDVAGEVTAIDTATHQGVQIRLPNGSTSLRGVCVSPDGKWAFVVHILSRYAMPTTQLERGWMNTNALSIINVAEKKLLNTVLLDDVDLGAANPWGVACTADGKSVCVTHAGTHELLVIDAPAMLDKLLKMPTKEEDAPADPSGMYSSRIADDVPNDLAFLVGMKRRIQLQGNSPWVLVKDESLKLNGPRGLAVVGSKAYVAVYFSDALAEVDLEGKPYKLVRKLPLGPEPKMTAQRLGQQNFHDASLCFQHWQSCSSCHPDARVDALNWDLMNDDMGNPKNVRSMLLAHKTPPAMSSGVRGTAEEAVRAGITHIQFAVRPEEDAEAIDEYLKSLQPVPSPHLVDGKLSEAAERGKKVFFDEKVGCAECHPAPLYTDLQMHDVASKGKYDRRDDFDTPTLIECWRTAPYMHDGHYLTVKELLVEGKHGEEGGRLKKLTEQQIDDLVEFVLSL